MTVRSVTSLPKKDSARMDVSVVDEGGPFTGKWCYCPLESGRRGRLDRLYGR